MKMKAISPVRSLRRNTSNLSDLNLGTSRSKSPLEDHLSLLYNMNDCYSKLRELVPSLPQNRSVTKMEILQHVIDYILDLQTALDSNTAFVNLQHPPRQSQTMARKPSASLGTDISLISFQPCDPPRETQCDDNRTLSR